MDKTWTIFDKGYTWNDDVTKSVTKWDITASGNFNVAASVQLTATVNFVLQVSHYKLQQLKVTLNGAVNAAVNAQGTVTAQYTFSKNIQAANIQLPTIAFAVAVIPVVIKPSVPVDVGVDISAEVQASVTMTAQASGSLTLGYQYGADGNFVPIKTLTLNYPKPIFSSTGIGTLTMAPYVQPSFVAQIDIIGSVYATLQVSARGIISFDESDPQCVLQGSLNIQTLLTLGASIQVKVAAITIVPQKTFGPWTVYQSKKPVWAACLRQKLRRDFKALQATTETNLTANHYMGRVYEGDFVPSDARCGFNRRTFSLQILSIDWSTFTFAFVGSINTDSDTGFQMQQLTYVATNITQLKTGIFVTLTQSQNDTIAWIQSSSDNATFILTSFNAIVSNDLLNIAFISPDNCSAFTLATTPEVSTAAGPTPNIPLPTSQQQAGTNSQDAATTAPASSSTFAVQFAVGCAIGVGVAVAVVVVLLGVKKYRGEATVKNMDSLNEQMMQNPA